MSMGFRHVLVLAAATALLVPACRNNSSNKQPDAPGGIDAPTIDSPSSSSCTGYMMSSIASMRQGAPGCYELDNVIALALTPSTSSPYLYVQDAAGGNYSAVETHCSSTSTSHPCSVAATVHGIPIGDSVTIRGTYIKAGAPSKYEEFYIDSITDNGAGTVPPPGAATLADIERGGTNYALAFQMVTLNIGANDQLQMYDWSPAELLRTATACPYIFGFGMIPKSTMNVTPGGACTDTMSQPAGVTSPDPTEVLFDTRFYKSFTAAPNEGFTTSSDCRCAGTYGDKEPTAGSTLSGAVSGILLSQSVYGTNENYMALAPTSVADAPITMTQ